jgi:hypothetical protein
LEKVRAAATADLLADGSLPAREADLKFRVWWLEHFDEFIDSMVRAIFGNERSIRMWANEFLGRVRTSEQRKERNRIVAHLKGVADLPEDEQQRIRHLAHTALKAHFECGS